MSKVDKIYYGDKVTLKDGNVGIVRYIGELPDKDKKTFYGIDLTKGNGKNDGTYKKKSYFKTKGNKKNGVFVVKSKITKTKTSINMIYIFYVYYVLCYINNIL